MKTIYETRFHVERQQNDSFTVTVEQPERCERRLYAFTGIDDLLVFLSSEKINFKRKYE